MHERASVTVANGRTIASSPLCHEKAAATISPDAGRRIEGVIDAHSTGVGFHLLRVARTRSDDSMGNTDMDS